MLGNLTGWHMLIILAVVILIFGAAKLPALAKSMGQSARILKSEMAAAKAESVPNTTSPAPGAAAPLEPVLVPTATPPSTPSPTPSADATAKP